MNDRWSHPSLSRYFLLLAALIVVALTAIGFWIAVSTYDHQSEKIIKQLENESVRVDRTLITEIEHTAYLLQSLGRQIVRHNTQDYTIIAQLLKSFDTDATVYNVFSWIDEKQRLVISSNKGIVDHGIDVSDRDYMKRALSDPWNTQIGRPIQGRVSEKWVIPISMGITDSTGKYVGTLLVSIDINALTNKIRHVIQQNSIDFAILSNSYTTLTEVYNNSNILFGDQQLLTKLQQMDVKENPRGLLSSADFFHRDTHYTFYELSSRYPYIILIGMSSDRVNQEVFALLLERLGPLGLVGVLLLALLWIIELRILKPLNALSSVTARIAAGEEDVIVPIDGPRELEHLALEVRRMSDYLSERRRIEGELQNKLQTLRRGKDSNELRNRMKTDFISCLGQELRGPLNAIMGFSEVMKDQLYGPMENPKYKQYASDIYQSARQFLQVIDDMLSLFQTDAGVIELQKNPTEVQAVINKCLGILSEHITQHKIAIQLKIQDNLPKLLVDETRLEQIVLNLLANAIQLSSHEGEIVIEAKLEQDSLNNTVFALIFKDNGRGLSPEELAALMGEKLADDAPTPRRKPASELRVGSGLGLPLTRMITAMHQAHLSIDSAPGKGTQITVQFPKERIVFWN